MAKRTSKHVTKHQWDQIIDSFITNGRNKTKAYQDTYTDCKTAPQCASALFKKPKFVKTLNLRLEEMKRKCDVTVGELQSKYQLAYNEAIRLGQPAAAVSAITGEARLFGMDKDNSLRDPVQILIIPPLESNNGALPGSVKSIDSIDVTSKELGETIQSTVNTQLNESEVV